MNQNGWTLLFHPCLLEQLARLKAASDRAILADPRRSNENANVKLYVSLAQLMLRAIPDDPSRDEFRQGNTLGPAYRHWRRAKFGQRFRLFFRYDSRSRIIIYAWVNDENTLRAAGSKRDPYSVFHKMLTRGKPPDTFSDLIVQSATELP